MRIDCEHGYFTFEEHRGGEISEFMSHFESLPIVRRGSIFTFEFLEDAPDYAIEGNPYLGVTATVSLSGTPGEIMRANGLVYDFITGTVKTIESITQSIELNQSSNYWVLPGLIKPGSVRDDGMRVTDYSAFYLFDSAKFKYSEVIFA